MSNIYKHFEIYKYFDKQILNGLRDTFKNLWKTEIKKLSKELRVMSPEECNTTSAAELAISANKTAKKFQVQHHERM